MIMDLSGPGLAARLKKTGVHEKSIAIFMNKSEITPLMVCDAPAPGANIIKQEMLSLGGDAAVHKNSVNCKVEKSDIILLGTKKHYKSLVEKLKNENYFNLKTIMKELIDLLNVPAAPPATALADGRTITYETARIMGIINATSDSFYGASRKKDVEAALTAAEKMLAEGADMLDIGGESSRPGSAPVSADEEADRVVPVISAIRKKFPMAVISVDTYRASTAQKALDAGADIINDITAMRFDKKMIDIAAASKAPVILMHSAPRAGNVNEARAYDDLVKEMAAYFSETISAARERGIDGSKLIIDPGIGFSKAFSDNIEIIRRIPAFKSFNLPLLIGASRKSFIGKILNDVPPEERLEGTIAVSALAVHLGADILRVHDVLANARAAKTARALKEL